MALTMSPPSPAASSASDGSSNSVSTGPPLTPVLSDLPLATPLPSNPKSTDSQPSTGTSSNAGGVKRTTKPNRRANTAERRATHNAVERQRRETLNGRFLDLAALLPNLSQIRRPSKSSIVNSSIAHINASRRHRLLAAQQLRLLKNETDALRHEVNEWRMRAGVPGVEEPHRADGFAVILSGELEFEAGDMMEGEEGEEDEDFGTAPGNMYGGRPYTEGGSSYAEPEEFIHIQQPQQRQQQVELMAQPFAAPEVQQPITIAIGAPQQRQSHSPPHYASPMIASPTTSAFDASMVYDQHARQLHQHQLMLQHHQQQQQQEENDKWAYQQQMRARGAW